MLVREQAQQLSSFKLVEVVGFGLLPLFFNTLF